MIFKKKPQKLEELKDLGEIVKYIKALEARITLLEKRIEDGEKASLNNFSKFSILRFNSFSDMGGDQSFTMTLLSKKNTGFVLTSLFHKDNTRVFTKPINNGISEYQLLKEEEIILKKAIDDQKEN
ncbi:MAG TPA: DUF4446 family protein [Candidatus Pacearchaeota archaeon]|nr:DUF4446 family protein [Candidatus Pacearchaeota archaeon]